MSIPSSARTFTASGFTPAASDPALWTRTASPKRARASPSAIWLRAEFADAEEEDVRRTARVPSRRGGPSAASSNQPRVRLHAAQTESMTGTSTRTPTVVARAAPEPGPKSAIEVATASSKKLLAPMSEPGAATACRTPASFMRP